MERRMTNKKGWFLIVIALMLMIGCAGVAQHMITVPSDIVKTQDTSSDSMHTVISPE